MNGHQRFDHGSESKLVSLPAHGNDSQRVNRLAEAGIIRKGATNLTWLLDESPLDIKSADLFSALADDREDRF